MVSTPQTLTYQSIVHNKYLYKNKSLPWKHITIEQNHSPHSTFPLTTELDQQYELIHSGRTFPLRVVVRCVPARPSGRVSVTFCIVTGCGGIKHCRSHIPLILHYRDFRLLLFLQLNWKKCFMGRDRCRIHR